jgi:hypothetical protein
MIFRVVDGVTDCPEEVAECVMILLIHLAILTCLGAQSAIVLFDFKERMNTFSHYLNFEHSKLV